MITSSRFTLVTHATAFLATRLVPSPDVRVSLASARRQPSARRVPLPAHARASVVAPRARFGDMEDLRAALAGSVSADEGTRVAADAFLKSAAARSGAALGLLGLASDAATEMGTRQSASIYFKHLVNKSWTQREGATATTETNPILDEGEKAAVRRVALEAIANTPSKVRSQLVEAVRVIVHHDFPGRWPEVANQVLDGLNAASSSESGKLCGTVLVLHALCRKYEFKAVDERADIEEMIRVVFPKLLEILKALLAYQGPPDTELEELKKAICKTYLSATYLNVGPSLREEGTFREWMAAFHAIITAPVPTENMPTDDKTELKHWPWWKTKKWAMHVVNRMFNRYGNLKKCQPHDKAQATVYRDKYAGHFVTVYIQLLSSLATGAVIPDRVVNLAVHHLSTALGVPTMYKHMEPHLDAIFQQIVFPMLCFSAEDDELWKDDPQEYVRKSQDLIEDMYSPRTAACSYTQELVITGRRLKENLPKVLGAMVQIFTKNSSSVRSGPMDARARYELDGALLVITTLSQLLSTHPDYAKEIEGMLMTHVIPAFGCVHGHIRAKAVSCVSKYSDITFRDQNNFMQLFSSVVNAMKDPEIPVRFEAVVGLGAFVQATDDVSALKGILPQLLDEFFKLMNEVESEDVVYTLETITEKFGEDIAPFALGMTQNLAAAFWKVVQEAEGKDDDEYGMMACMGCLRAMSTILESVSSLPHMYPELEAAVFPILHKMISEEGYDVFEEVLEILSYLTYFTPVVTPRMWELWPLMMRMMDDWALQYFENMLIPLDNYISRGTEHFLTPGSSYVEDTYKLCEKVLGGDYPEPDCLPAPKLMECVMTNCRGRVDVVIEPYVNIALACLATAELPHFRDWLMMTYAHALHYNASLALAATNRTGKTNEVFALWSNMLAERRKSGERKNFTSEHAKKVCALGLMALLQAPAESLTPEIRGALGGILDTLISLLEDLRWQITERKSDEASGKSRHQWNGLGLFDGEDEYEEHNFDEEDDDGEMHFDATTLRALAKQAQDADPYSRAGDVDSEDDEHFFFDDDDDSCQSPLDDIDTFIVFSECMNQLHRTGSLNPSAESHSKLQELINHAAIRAEEFPRERAEAKKESHGVSGS